ncbi:hypothetical protein IscW_ISCW002299 [Ixodes scapularis]|uniref:Uncharacterized protein n=1 Tax=Ixodes scapularis TaxID=6945 RepID=B7P7T3_IXOSC|nr:hypothetical protein IscW_ISCW002299 [Ixodes scapularis]|eukprot:XP_002399567.1 hypothetical protein IscW_ISCW002299 [Ixodes scapularis]
MGFPKLRMQETYDCSVEVIFAGVWLQSSASRKSNLVSESCKDFQHFRLLIARRLPSLKASLNTFSVNPELNFDRTKPTRRRISVPNAEDGDAR